VELPGDFLNLLSFSYSLPKPLDRSSSVLPLCSASRAITGCEQSVTYSLLRSFCPQATRDQLLSFQLDSLFRLAYSLTSLAKRLPTISLDEIGDAFGIITDADTSRLRRVGRFPGASIPCSNQADRSHRRQRFAAAGARSPASLPCARRICRAGAAFVATKPPFTVDNA